MFMGFRIHFILKISTLEIVKIRFRQKKSMKFNFLMKNWIFDQKLQFSIHNVEICKIAFFCEYQYLGFFKSQQIFSGTSKPSAKCLTV